MLHLAPVKVLLGVVLTVLGAGGVAAAVNGEIPAESDPWSPSSVLYGVSEQSTADGTLPADNDGTEEAGEEELETEIDAADGLSDDELEVLCAEAGSHGEYVSQVARDQVTETEGNHGARVREAAQSDCGKSGDDEEPPSAEAEIEEELESEVDAADGLSDDELEVLCAEAGTHGEYVSQVARDRITETDGNHGARVRDAAQSDCGKSGDAGEDEAESNEAVESDLDHPASGNGNGNGGGNGNGNGNGQAVAARTRRATRRQASTWRSLRRPASRAASESAGEAYRQADETEVIEQGVVDAAELVARQAVVGQA